MIVLDANLILYAYVPDFPQHERASAWLEKTLSNGEHVVLIAWQVATAFLRISTNPRIFDDPLSMELAKSYLDHLFSHPFVRQVNPTDRHWEIYSKILIEQNLTGDIVMDAHIAAIAVEHNAIVASTDKHFRRFSEYVKTIDPLEDGK
ncbi:MAG TPA: TA system VapC family ribonuclease toxin [Pyrinomonadaceae bacterium]|nr:TA system VapC family ribonuclease toxin [Pyrinomonadaceae bacterium]